VSAIDQAEEIPAAQAEVAPAPADRRAAAADIEPAMPAFGFLKPENELEQSVAFSDSHDDFLRAASPANPRRAQTEMA